MRERRSFALVVAVALAASLTSLRGGFVYDDVPVVQHDPRIHSLDSLGRLIRSPYWSSGMRDRIYRPVTTVSFALDWAVGRGSPLAFHLTNVVLHALVCALVFALATLAIGRGPGAMIAALWFAVHPVHVEAVANVVGRSELLAALCYLAAVLAYGAEGALARTAPGSARRALLTALVLLFAALAFGSKEHALTLPAALLLVDWWQRSFKAHALTWLGVLAVAIGYLAARQAVLGTTFGGGSVGAGLEGHGIFGRAAIMAPAMLVWARLLVFPLALSADYSPNHFVPTASLGIAGVAGAMLVIAVVMVAIRLRRSRPALSVGIAGFIVTAAIAANVLFPTGVLLAERLLYLPSVGAAIAIGALWQRWRSRAAWPVTAAALTLLGARTLARIPTWQDGERFYASLVADAPDSYRAHWARGARAFEQRRAHEGEQEYLAAVHIFPKDAELLQELGQRYLGAGLDAPADRWFTQAFRTDPLRADAAAGAVIARLHLGRADSAAALGDAALRGNPAAPTLLLVTGDAWFALGKPALSLTYRRRMVYAFPSDWQFQYLAAEGAARAGRCEEARRRADRAVRLGHGGQAAAQLRAALGEGPTCRVGA